MNPNGSTGHFSHGQSPYVLDEHRKRRSGTA
jgi:hypothetical protein